MTGGNFKKDVYFSLSYRGKFADLQFMDWLTNKICGFAICNLQCNQKKFADLRLRIEPKYLRILQKVAWQPLGKFATGVNGGAP